MKKLRALIIAVGVFLVLPGLTLASEATQVADFDNSVVDVKLLRHHFQAFAVMANTDGGVDVYRANRRGDNWSQIPANSPTIDALPNSESESNVEGIDTIRVYNKSLHMLVTTANGPELWSIKLHNRPANWKQTGDAGLGVNATSATHMFNQYVFPARNNHVGSLIVATVVDGQAQLVAYNDGEWSALGEVGLGNDVASVTDSARFWVGGTQYILLSTDSGKIYKSAIDDLTTWEEFADAEAEITAMRTYKGTIHIATKTDEGVDYMMIEANSTEITRPTVEPYFSAADEITGFRTFYRGAPLHALVRDTSEGASIARYNKVTGEWSEVLGEGLGDTDNTAITSLIKYHGKRYAATNGENQIYRLSN